MAAPSHQARARGLLRSLLRESSYLPDVYARRYMKSYALERFRRHRAFERERRALGIDAFPHPISQEHQAVRRRRTQYMALGKSWARVLHRAGAQLQVKPLLRVLGMTYGRLGERRWSLVGALNANDLTAKGNDLVRRTFAPRKYQQSFLELLPTMSRQLEKLLASQRMVNPPELFRLNPKKVGISIDEKNIFMRPMPRKRVKNATHKQYNALLARALPPLPQEEFTRIEALAAGSMSPEPSVPRRPRARSQRDGGILPEHDEHSSLMQALQITPTKTRRAVENDHCFTPRLMARLYQRILLNCPVMSWDPDKQDWFVTWGSRRVVTQASRARNQALARHLNDEESTGSGDGLAVRQALGVPSS